MVTTDVTGHADLSPWMGGSKDREQIAKILLELIDALEVYRTEGEAALVIEIRKQLSYWARDLSWAWGLSEDERTALIWGPHARARQVALRLRIG